MMACGKELDVLVKAFRLTFITWLFAMTWDYWKKTREFPSSPSYLMRLQWTE